MCNIIQNLGMFCLDKIMLIFKIPKLFHFQRTLMQVHFPRSITNTDLPALPPIPAKQAGLAQAGRGPRSQKPRDSVPGRTTHPQLLALHEEMPSPRPLSCSRGRAVAAGGTPRWKATSGYYRFCHRSQGAQLRLLSVIPYNTSEMQHFVTGRRKGRVGF